MSPDCRLGVSSWYKITDPVKLEDAVLHLSRQNVMEAGQIIEDRINTLFASDEKQKNELLDHLRSLTPRPRGRK